MSTETVWLIVGFGGQGLFFARWLVQWLRSERDKESTIPLSFWYLSLVGGLITFVYAVHRQDPVFITGQAVGTFVYLRNLVLIHRARSLPKASKPGTPPFPPAPPAHPAS